MNRWDKTNLSLCMCVTRVGEGYCMNRLGRSFVRPSDFFVSAHFQTNRSRNWSPAYGIHSLWHSQGLINF